jgi:hypothetical protein
MDKNKFTVLLFARKISVQIDLKVKGFNATFQVRFDLNNGFAGMCIAKLLMKTCVLLAHHWNQ